MGDGNDTPVWEKRESGQEVPSRLSSDQFYRALATAQRRRLLSFLLTHRESTIDELATALAGWHATGRGTMTTPGEREQTAIRLRHVHLPLLEDAGLVEYDPGSETVSIEQLDPLVSDLVDWSIGAEDVPRP